MASSSIIKFPASASQFSPLSLARMMWLHKGAILAIWLVVSGITAAVVYNLPVLYDADVEVLVYPQEIPERMVPTVVNTNIQDRLATIEAEILGAAQLQKVIDDFGLYKKERKTHIPEEILQIMRSAISVKLEKGWTGNQPGAFLVSYIGEDPAVVTQVANRLGSLFVEGNFRTRTTQVRDTKDFLDTLLEDAKKRLDDSEGAIAVYKQNHNGELPEQVAAIASNVGRLQAEVAGNRDAIARAEQAKMTIQNILEQATAGLQSLLDRPEAQPIAPVARPDEPTLVKPPVRVAKQSEVLENQLETLRGRGYGEAHPEVKRLKVAITSAKDEEAKAEQTKVELAKAELAKAEQLAKSAPPPVPVPEAPKVADSPPPVQPASAPERPEIVAARERVKTIEGQITLIDKEIADRTANQDKLAQAVEEAQARLMNVPVREQEIARIMRDHGNIEGEYQALLSKSATAKLSEDMEVRNKSERFSMNDTARPGRTLNPERGVFDALGSILGFGLGCCFALGREFHHGRLLGAWELPEEVLVLARVPRITPAHSLPGQSLWARWSKARRVAVVSCVLLPVLGLLAVARVYLVH